MSSSGSCNKSFCSNYMLLNPEEAAFADVVKILFSDDIAKRRFVDCPAGTQEPLGRRWIIFISILAQKFLQATAKPLAGFGAKVEYWLNLLNGNRGFFGLIMNSFKGKVVEPDTTSGSFLSFTGNIDKRIELDPTIGSGDKRYYASLSVMASKASYENKEYIESVVKDHWKVSSSSLEVGVVPDHNAGMTDVSKAEAIPVRVSGMERLARVLRYKEKRKNRRFEKTIRYASRKAYAETRPRVKGRFARRSELQVEPLLSPDGIVPMF